MANNTCVIAQPHQSKVPIHRQVISSRPFVAVGYPENSPNDPFARSVIEAQLNNRLALKDYPSQVNASLCGPAVFFYCLLLSSPNVYKNTVWQLWSTGETQIGYLRIKPSNGCKHPTKFLNADCSSKISGLDWITLASLRDSKNFGVPYKSPDDEIAGITLPDEIPNWFKDAGFTLVKDLDLEIVRNFISINDYFSRPNHFVVSLINTKLLDKTLSPLGIIPDHWVVWSSTLNTSQNTPINANVKPTEELQLSVFSWGQRYHRLANHTTLAQFQLYHKRAYIFKW